MGIYKTRRACELTSAAAQITFGAQLGALERFVLQPCRDGAVESLHVHINYDATALKTQFGRMQDLVMNHARYFVPDSSKQSGWRTVDVAEWGSLNKKAKPQSGVLEHVAQCRQVGWTTRTTNTEGPASALRKLIVPAVFSASAAASVVHNSLEASVPGLSVEQILVLARRADFVFYHRSARRCVSQHAAEGGCSEEA